MRNASALLESGIATTTRKRKLVAASSVLTVPAPASGAVSALPSMAAKPRSICAWRSMAALGSSGIIAPSGPPTTAITRPLALTMAASCAWSRTAESCRTWALSGRSASSRARLRARSLKSCSEESSAARPRLRPDSSADSTRTSNHDSIERDTNCTDTR